MSAAPPILKDMEQVKVFLSRYNISFDPAMNRGYLLRPPRNGSAGT